MPERILVLAPHPDDESIGCGGMICLHQRRGNRVFVVFLTSGERGLEAGSDDAARSIREAEAAEACQVLGVDQLSFLRLPDSRLGEAVGAGAERLRPLLEAERPALIYLPHPEEAHPDHGAALPIVRRALDGWSSRSEMPELHAYEVWSPMTHAGWVEDISAVIRLKMCAIRRHRSQLESFRYDRAIRGLNRYRGILGAGSSYAEAFQYYDQRQDLNPIR